MKPKGCLYRCGDLFLVKIKDELALVAPLRTVRKLPIAFNATIAPRTLKGNKITASRDAVIPSELNAESFKAGVSTAVERSDSQEIRIGG